MDQLITINEAAEFLKNPPSDFPNRTLQKYEYSKNISSRHSSKLTALNALRMNGLA